MEMESVVIGPPPTVEVYRLTYVGDQLINREYLYTDEYDVPPPPEECPVCGLKETGAPEGRCMNCDNPKLNHCLPEYDQAQHWCPADALFCETCGARTLYSELPVR